MELVNDGADTNTSHNFIQKCNGWEWPSAFSCFYFICNIVFVGKGWAIEYSRGKKDEQASLSKIWAIFQCLGIEGVSSEKLACIGHGLTSVGMSWNSDLCWCVLEFMYTH